jgi:hypothetical protein
VHTNGVNAIRDVLSGQDNGHMDDRTTIRDEENDAQGQLVDDSVQPITNVATETPIHCD